jgi:hypothetical protein
MSTFHMQATMETHASTKPEFFDSFREHVRSACAFQKLVSVCRRRELNNFCFIVVTTNIRRLRLS